MRLSWQALRGNTLRDVLICMKHPTTYMTAYWDPNAEKELTAKEDIMLSSVEEEAVKVVQEYYGTERSIVSSGLHDAIVRLDKVLMKNGIPIKTNPACIEENERT